MASQIGDILALCMVFAQCFLGCYFCIWLAEAALEYYTPGMLNHIPDAAFYTIIAAAIGASACVLANAIKKKEGDSGKTEPPKY